MTAAVRRMRLDKLHSAPKIRSEKHERANVFLGDNVTVCRAYTSAQSGSKFAMTDIEVCPPDLTCLACNNQAWEHATLTMNC